MTAAEVNAIRRRSVPSRLLDLSFIPSFVLRRRPACVSQSRPERKLNGISHGCCGAREARAPLLHQGEQLVSVCGGFSAS
ncbi:hypothetical protein TNCT6_07680 [Streptomyces sp. 6-11-2]|nr:hypothetical protein TNCT6_07680 [Streptomyces sp. 6-11-2]